MKKHLLTFLLGLFISINLLAQPSIKNGNFENWTNINYEFPQNYPINSNLEEYGRQNPFNCLKTIDAYHGTYAVKLTTNPPENSAYFVNSEFVGPNASNWHGGIPYNQIPTGIRGYYKSDIQPGDTGLIIVSFSLAGNNIGTFIKKIYGTQSSYTLFTENFTLPTNPDSIAFAATSSDVFNNIAIPGSMLQLDSVSLIGVTNQPTLLNGDFENWQSQTFDECTGWYGDMFKENTLIVEKTTDSKMGNFALKLTTIAGTDEDTGLPKARSAKLGTGDFTNGGQTFIGGYPFSNIEDTLTFWYKYSPSNNDLAIFDMFFKANGSTVFGGGDFLTSSQNYQYYEYPFYIGSLIPDTAMVRFGSSAWQNDSIIYAGSVLIIDEVTFKSQPLTTSLLNISNPDDIAIYPNPAKTNFTLNIKNNPLVNLSMNIYNSIGALVKTETLTQNKQVVNIEDLPDGLYTVELISQNWIKNQKLLIQH